MIFYLKGKGVKLGFALAAALVSVMALADQTTSGNTNSQVTIAPSQNSSVVKTSRQELFDQRVSALLCQLSPKQATTLVQLGVFSTSQANSQNIGIQGLIGDRFTVNPHYYENILVGLGYYLPGSGEHKRYSLMYGLNAFYLAPTITRGNVIQEQLFTNLSYRYSLTNYPIYLAARALIDTNSTDYRITVDVGLGPNIINTGNVNEYSIDGGVTLPDRMFTGTTTVAFSATAGVGIKFDKLFGYYLPVELGYRFFYLGEGQFNKANSQVTNTLNAGNNYANALVLSISN